MIFACKKLLKTREQAPNGVAYAKLMPPNRFITVSALPEMEN